ncbi:MAG: hypothetical protein ACR2IE_05250 [Candidatus Sumerlaeaceae bacterium]
MGSRVNVFPIISNVSGGGSVVVTWWAEVRDDKNRLVVDENGRLQRIRLTPTYPDPARRKEEIEQHIQDIWETHGHILQANTALGFDEVERQR